MEPIDKVMEKIHYLPHHAVVRHNKETTKIRMIYDAPASPFLLNATIQHHLDQYQETQPELVCKSFCVEDLVIQAGDEEQAYRLFTDSRKKEISTFRNFDLIPLYCSQELTGGRIN